MNLIHKLELRQKNMEVCEMQSEFDLQWLNFVNHHPAATIFHHPLWVQALEKEYGTEAIRLVCRGNNGMIEGVLPLLPTRGLPFIGKKNFIITRRISCLPRTPISGLLSNSSSATRLLLDYTIEKIFPNSRSVIQVKHNISSIPQMSGFQKIPWRSCYVISLPEDPAEIRFGNSRNHSRIKWAVNKANKSGIKLRMAERKDDLKKWYRLYLKTMRRNVAHVRSYRFMEILWKHLRPEGMMRLLLAERYQGNKKIITAGSLLLMYNKTVFYAFNGGTNEDRSNDLIQWQAIHTACAEGYRYYDLGEVSHGHSSLADFKRKWGAKEEQLYHFYYPSQDLDNLIINPTKSHYIVRKLWQITPLKITEFLSDCVYYFL